ncbi:hypothetical protein RJ55_06068 [Drechmeria coniospora]|nr:hypothetical protein RJ55_06068 [Drechmeria coniospora]
MSTPATIKECTEQQSKARPDLNILRRKESFAPSSRDPFAPLTSKSSAFAIDSRFIAVVVPNNPFNVISINSGKKVAEVTSPPSQYRPGFVWEPDVVALFDEKQGVLLIVELYCWNIDLVHARSFPLLAQIAAVYTSSMVLVDLISKEKVMINEIVAKGPHFRELSANGQHIVSETNVAEDE